MGVTTAAQCESGSNQKAENQQGDEIKARDSGGVTIAATTAEAV